MDIFTALKNLKLHLEKKRYIHFALVICFTIISSFAELLSIGAIIPFLAVLADPDLVFAHPLSQPIINILNLNYPSELVLPITIMFIVGALFAASIRITLLWIQLRFSNSVSADISLKVFRHILHQQYLVHVQRNSSEVIAFVTTKSTALVKGIITPSLIFISGSFTLMTILLALIAFNPSAAISIFIFLGFSYIGISSLASKSLDRSSAIINKKENEIFKVLQEAIGAIRDLIIDRTQKVYTKIYHAADVEMKKSQARIMLIGSTPKALLEALGMIIIALVAYWISRDEANLNKIIPTLGVLALGAQRLLPLLQQLFLSYSQMRGSSAQVKDLFKLLDDPLPPFTDAPILNELSLNNTIKFNNLSFGYNGNEDLILKNINFTINKGDKVGLIGETGCGKSTTLDILMSLLPPTKGALLIDGNEVNERNQHEWRAQIAHVPQSIYLADASVLENIAFGVVKERINFDLAKDAARKASILDAINDLPEGFDSWVGERGVKLSGGQRQRIGIARALYKGAKVIIFDEATSALDTETENEVMKSIQDLSDEITIIIVAHRLSTLKSCNKIIELHDGKLSSIGTYDELIKNV